MHHPKTKMQKLFSFDIMQWDMQQTLMLHYFQMEWKESMFNTKRHEARNKIKQKWTQNVDKYSTNANVKILPT